MGLQYRPNHQKVGLPWDVSGFVVLTLHLGHPFLSGGAGDDMKDMLDAVFIILTQGPSKIRKSREELLKRLRRRKEERRADQQRVYGHMHQYVKDKMVSEAIL